jgi:hypothetical protein
MEERSVYLTNARLVDATGAPPREAAAVGARSVALAVRFCGLAA